jgi:hypothetical protein
VVYPTSRPGGSGNPEAGIFGNGHTMALEKNNKRIMYRMIAWLEGNGFKPK